MNTTRNEIKARIVASNFSNKLQRNSLRYREVVELADVIGYELKWVPRKRGDADDECRH